MRFGPPVSLLFIALVVAGCSGPSATTSSTAPAVSAASLNPPAQGLVFHKDGGVIVSASHYPGEPPVFAERYVGTRGAGEPTIGVNARGTAIFPSIAFDVAGGQLASTRVFISKDEGNTWNDRSPSIANLALVPAQPTSLDPYVYADPVTGRLYTMDLYLGCSNASWTDDDGATWVTNPVVCGIPVDDHQTLSAGPARTLPVVPAPVGTGRMLYYCVNQIGASTCTHSVDGGLTWTAGIPPYPGVEQQPDGNPVNAVCGGLHGHIHVSEVSGTLFVPKIQCGRPEVARSTDGGLTFTRSVIDFVSGGTGHDGAVATDAAGHVYYFWLDSKGFPRLAVSQDDGVTWGASLNVTAPGVTAAKFPAITAGADGRIAFYYVGSTVKGGFDANATVMANATWSGYAGFSLNATQEDPVFATVTIHPAADPLKRGDCGGRCGGMFDFFDIQVNPKTGQVWASAVDLCNDACALAAGTSKDPVTSRGAVGVQVGGTLLGSPLPA